MLHCAVVPGNTVLPYLTWITFELFGTWNVTHPVLVAPLFTLIWPLSKLPQFAMGL